MEGIPCHACGARSLQLVEEFKKLHRVTSDCRPWSGHGELAICGSCGLVQKPVSSAWRDEAVRIYSNYHMYHQATGGEEQKVVSDLGFERRSDVLLSWAKSKLLLNETGRFLDFGCGSGSTLRSAARILSNWDLFGYEPHIHDPAPILGIPGVKGLLSHLRDVPLPFGLITMMHVIEHIPDPASAIAEVAKVLAKDGVLFLQVPYFVDSPYELTVADHCSHFTMQTLARLVNKAGLAVSEISTNVVKREITLVAAHPQKPEAGRPAQPRVDLETIATSVSAQVRWLLQVVEESRAASRPPFGIFGTAIAGSWLYSHLSDMVDFFVDEDASRVGKTFLDRPVYLPLDIPMGATVYVALNPDIARSIRDRYANRPVSWLVPPHWSRPEIDIRASVS